jgi:hypothetical protein
LSVKYFGLANTILNFFVGETVEYIQWFFSGILSLLTKLSMKGVIEEFAKEKVDLLKSYFIIYCEDKPEGERPGKGITWGKKEFGSEFMGGLPCTVLTEDFEGKPIWIPDVKEHQLRNDPFIGRNRSILTKMNSEQIGIYNALNEEIKTFENTYLQRQMIYGPLTDQHPFMMKHLERGRIYGELMAVDHIKPKTHSLQQFNAYSRTKLEREAFYKQMAAAYENK